MPIRRTVFFTAPRCVEVREEQLPAPGPGQLLVETLCSAISSGTELLVYRGEFPRQVAVDAVIPALVGDFSYPLAYGYSAVGRVANLGQGLSEDWIGRLVFSFQPHTTHFLTTPEAVHIVPEGCSPETACFLPNTETAVSLVQDGAPLLGERALVLGQGIIGLLTTALLAAFPLESLVTADCFPARRKAALELGATACLDPGLSDFRQQARLLLPSGADLTFELSGQPATLNDAIALTTFSGRVLIGSWYGEKQAPIALGSTFHRSRIRLFSSQVSSIAPELCGRWNKPRRFDVTWKALHRIQPERWVTQRFSIEEAVEAYRFLDQASAETIQILFDHR